MWFQVLSTFGKPSVLRVSVTRWGYPKAQCLVRVVTREGLSALFVDRSSINFVVQSTLGPRSGTDMTSEHDLKALEQEAFSNAYSDGIFDLFVGISLIWIGIAWLWLPDLAGLAGVFPAILIAPVIQVRKRLVEPRIGYVKWSDVRESKERRTLAQMLAFGVLVLVVGVGVFLVTVQDDANTDSLALLVPALPVWLLGVGAALFGVVSGVPRALGYAAILAVAGGATIWLDQGPGVGLFVSGVLITLIALTMVVSFFGRNKPVEAP